MIRAKHTQNNSRLLTPERRHSHVALDENFLVEKTISMPLASELKLKECEIDGGTAVESRTIRTQSTMNSSFGCQKSLGLLQKND